MGFGTRLLPSLRGGALKGGTVFLQFVLFAGVSLYAQTLPPPAPVNFEFVNQDIRDILYSLSVYRKVPIVADDTVSGTATLQYSGTDFGAAFDAFLSVNRLFVDKSDVGWTVSKIRIGKKEDGTMDVDVYDLSPDRIFEHLSGATGRTVVRDILPSAKVSIRLSGVSLGDALRVIMTPYTDYEVIETDTFAQVRKGAERTAATVASPSGNVEIGEVGGRYSVSGERFRLAEALDALFLAAKREYSSFVRGDAVIERLAFGGKTFDEALTLVLDQAGAEAAQSDGMWYVLPGQQSEIARRLRNGGKDWVRFPLRYAPYQQLQALLISRYPELDPVPLPDGNGFFARVTPGENADLSSYLQTIDASGFRGTVRLKYIKPEELLHNIPPSIKRENLVDSGNGNALFFVGTRERYAEFAKDLEILDRPKPRIRYDLLIVQYQDTSDLKWGFNVDARSLAPGDQTLVTGSLGNILKLNFDVITVLGYRFATQLDMAISDNQANVFADTTLYGLSGQEIKFQNTNTYRYRDYYIDSQTQETVYTGVTREITSGLLLNVSGWVSGDGMVSKRGADVSSKVGNPPPTSEKTITTQVRSRSGETVVLSGLRQNDSTFVEERVPFFSRIPLVGWLFKNRQTSTEKNQMVIYLIPHVDESADVPDRESQRIGAAYARFVAPYLGVPR